jgi:hypothetical protein
MKSRITVGMVAAALVLGFTGGTDAQTQDRVVRPVPKQRVQVQKRAPTRIIVRPLLRERLDSTEFPRSDYLGYPGPNAVRQCVSWLQPEYRPSGTVVTPQMRCWWQRG